jgi:hypothetical protein
MIKVLPWKLSTHHCPHAMVLSGTFPPCLANGDLHTGRACNGRLDVIGSTHE